MSKIHTIGIVGGGISGALVALQSGKYGIDSILFEQEKTLVNGPPFCHLHAGGNLYPDISDEQCRILMKQAIEMARLFPQSIDERPTFISIPKSEKNKVESITHRLDMLVAYYAKLINDNPSNEVLGSPENYYKAYTKDDLIALADQATIKHPKTADQWMTNTIKFIDYDKLKTPVFIVQEYGWNLFRLGAQAQLALEKTETCSLKTHTTVTKVKDVRNQHLDYNWEISTNDSVYKVKYLVNSCGFKTGKLDESLHLKTERLIEFKAAYVSQWQPIPGLIPELIFHGERGTPHGMVQLTPYFGDFYQIHGMTKEITLFENGLIQSKSNETQPEFNDAIQQKLNRNWKEDEIKSRTGKAIESVTQFVPSFKSATVGGPPLYGAQQIPGDDPSLRVGEVSFPSQSYARSEIVKASSSLNVANQIINRIQEEKIIPTINMPSHQNILLERISKNEIDTLASELAEQRGYPKALSRLLIEKKATERRS